MKPARQSNNRQPWPWIGQAGFAAAARSMLDRDQWPATVLLSGPSRLGKASTARWLAQRDLCDRKVDAPCGMCQECRLVTSGSHADFFLVSAGPTAITRDELLEQFQRFRWKATSSKTQRRWIILTDVDQLHESIGNALLKIIEEPPVRTSVLMTSSSPDQILPTIRSRAVEFRWHRVPYRELDDQLTARFPKLSPSLRRTICRQANGRPGQALQTAAYPEILGDHWTNAQTLLRGLQSGRWPLRRDWTGEDLDQAELLVRDALLVTSGVSPRTWSNEVAAITAFATELGSARLQHLAVRLRNRWQLLRQHVQPSFILHDLSI